MVARSLARTARTLQAVRRRLSRPLTLADKLLLGHLADPLHQDMEPGRSQLKLRPDRVAFQDVLGQSGMPQFTQTGPGRVAVPQSLSCAPPLQPTVGTTPALTDSQQANRQ